MVKGDLEYERNTSCVKVPEKLCPVNSMSLIRAEVPIILPTVLL